MSIPSPLKDGLYIRPIRPERRSIRLFIKYYQYIVGVLISLVVAASLFLVNPMLTVLVLLGYWAYIFTRLYLQTNKIGMSIYPHPLFQLLRAISVVASVTVLLHFTYDQTSYLSQVQDDALWLLYFPAIAATSQRSSRAIFFSVLAIVIASLFLVHPVEDMRILIAGRWPVTQEFIIKAGWLFLLSFTSYIMIRYMSDAVADLNLIIKVQNKMRELESVFVNSESNLNISDYFEKAVEAIKDDIFYDHANIFRLDKYNRELICMAGACPRGKSLAHSGYVVNIIDRKSIIGYVARSKTSYVSNNVLHDPHYMPHDAFPDTRAELVVPIKVRDRLYGVLDIQVHQTDYFLEQELKAIEILANHIGWVIDSSEQMDHINWMNRIIGSIAAPIFTPTYLDDTLQEIADSALEELKADLVFIYSFDPNTREGISGPIYSGELLHPEWMDPLSSDPESIVVRLAPSGERIYIHDDLDKIDIHSHALFQPSPTHVFTGKPTFIQREQIKSNVIIRLLSNHQCVGILFLNFRRPRTFSDWEQKRYTSFADLAALAVQKIQLQQHIIQKEKNDMSNLIHDVLVGDTVGLFKILKSIDLSGSKGSATKEREKLELAVDAMEQLNNDIRWINNLLKEDYSDNLESELEKLFGLYERVFHVKARAVWKGDISLMSSTLNRELFIIVREALTNAVRHGKAQTVVVMGVIRASRLNATIRDDGVGFHPRHVKRMSGLLSMRYRVQEMGGAFKLTSSPGKGTKISLKVPLTSPSIGA